MHNRDLTLVTLYSPQKNAISPEQVLIYYCRERRAGVPAIPSIHRARSLFILYPERKSQEMFYVEKRNREITTVITIQ